LVEMESSSLSPENAPRAGETAADSDLDEQLLQLPDPPRAERTWSLLAMTASAAAALALTFAIRGEIAFALSSTQNQVRITMPLERLPPEGLVTASLTLGATGAIRMDRPLVDGSERIFPVLGRDDLWVATRSPKTFDAGRFVPPSEVSGRVVMLNAPGIRYRGALEAIEQALGHAPPKEARLLIDGETPSSLRWALLLGVCSALFALWNAVTALRMFRRIRES
jgi:hypothetical protein